MVGFSALTSSNRVIGLPGSKSLPSCQQSEASPLHGTLLSFHFKRQSQASNFYETNPHVPLCILSIHHIPMISLFPFASSYSSSTTVPTTVGGTVQLEFQNTA
ncbi:hypothetical protein POX_b03343 [Penicillium oxalicum]|uniref:hypothetical protein n=1 Tax=Penicillium oxalicum TaxID=69781 RepID=UPI0020B69701|nr:hypothetical protein POX_b03343 [Penicillium oxalicum]KAI2793289.1 hypothetical protein POX_b03343 [Penicillium oxalicum]